MTIKKLMELVRDNAHKDVEMIVIVRDGTVHYSLHKVKRTRDSLRSLLHPDKAKQLTAGRVTGTRSYDFDDIDDAAAGMAEDLVENALKAGVELHWNRD